MTTLFLALRQMFQTWPFSEIRHQFQSVLKVKIHPNASEIGSKLHTNASNCLKAAKVSFLDQQINNKSSKSALFETSGDELRQVTECLPSLKVELEIRSIWFPRDARQHREVGETQSWIFLSYCVVLSEFRH